MKVIIVGGFKAKDISGGMLSRAMQAIAEAR
jgi:hypothetical protein